MPHTVQVGVIAGRLEYVRVTWWVGVMLPCYVCNLLRCGQRAVLFWFTAAEL
jgi:hypothetical protein